MGLGRADIAGVQAYAQVVEELLGSAILARQRHTIVDQLSRALENRVVIERAVGVLMATEGIDAVRAFDALRRAARSRRVRVSELAEEILSARSVQPETDGSEDPMNPVVVTLSGDIDLACARSHLRRLADAVASALRRRSRRRRRPLRGHLPRLDGHELPGPRLARRSVRSSAFHLSDPPQIARRVLEIAGLGWMIRDCPPA